jgi:hypothetical protein
LQGLKPNVDFIGFVGTTKVLPWYKACEVGYLNEFFRRM